MKSLRHANFKVLGGVILSTNGCDWQSTRRHWKLVLRLSRNNTEPIDEGVRFFI